MGVENVMVGPAFGSGLEDGIVAGVAGLTGLAGGFSADCKGLRAMIREEVRTLLADLLGADRPQARRLTRVRHSEQNSLPQASKHG
jgi:hypothetical protein